MRRSFISFPIQWDYSILFDIIKSNTINDISISEVYGVPINGFVPDGRMNKLTKRISKEESIKFRELVNKHNISFNYLLNAPFTKSINKEKQLDSYLDWIINEFKANSVTISSIDLMDHFRKRYPEFPLKISTIAGILNTSDLESYLKFNPSKIVVHHDVNRNFDDMNRIIDLGSKLNVDIEVMTTESCLRRCPNRKSHYNTFLTGKSDMKFHQVCNTNKLLFPSEFLKANIIRPEDLSFYEKKGLNYFKITGRSKDASWMKEVVESYINRSYDGNLLRLTGIDPRLKAESFIYINNKSLDGFIDNYPDNPSQENTYCDEWIIKLWKNNDFFVEGADYKIKNNKLVCVNLPKRLEKVYIK